MKSFVRMAVFVVALMLSLFYFNRERENTKHSQGIQKITTTSGPSSNKLSAFGVIALGGSPPQELRKQEKKTDLSSFCDPETLAEYSFDYFIQKSSNANNRCGLNLPTEEIKKCSEVINNKIENEACFILLRSYFALQINILKPDSSRDQPDKIVAAKILHELTNPNGIDKERAKTIIPHLTQMIERYPNDPSLYRIFVMLKSSSLLLEPLSEKDAQYLNKALELVSDNQSVRDGIVSIFSLQADGFEKIKQFSQSFPNDAYPYASIASLYLEKGQRQKAIEWAKSAADHNPSNAKLAKLRNDLMNHKFNIRDYITFSFDILGILQAEQ